MCSALYSPQPFNYHISFCGDLDVVGVRKPQSYLRAVLFNASRMEMGVHAPVASGEKEVRR
jgi:beta-galactosidase